MLTQRAWAVLGGAVALWAASRVVGSPDLHILAVGILALVPLAALAVRFRRPRLRASRRLSVRRAFPGTRIEVEIDVRNEAPSGTSPLLLEDRVPPTLGPPARMVVPPVPPRARQAVAYELTPRRRGRYLIGPLTVQVADPFDLVRHRAEFDDRHDLVVYPEIEPLEAASISSPIGGAGESTARQLFRSGEEFYTMRHYEIGDDLRRIHWPSTARSGQLMIRQDEGARQAAAVVYLDTRRTATGRGREAFERAVSATASIGALYLRSGYSIRLATPDLPPRPMEWELFLETLAMVQPSRLPILSPSLERIRSTAGANPCLVVITHAPDTEEVAALSQLSTVYGSKLAVLLEPHGDEAPLPARAEARRRVNAARLSLLRAGWEVLPVDHGRKLTDAWQRRSKRPALRTTSSS